MFPTRIVFTKGNIVLTHILSICFAPLFGATKILCSHLLVAEKVSKYGLYLAKGNLRGAEVVIARGPYRLSVNVRENSRRATASDLGHDRQLNIHAESPSSAVHASSEDSKIQSGRGHLPWICPQARQ